MLNLLQCRELKSYTSLNGVCVSEFCGVLKENLAESLQPLINIYFPKIVGEGGGRGCNID
jgi:hypothetical protein